MAEGRLERDQKRLTAEMNEPYVEENLYVKSLQNRDIPYETWLTTFDSPEYQNKVTQS